MAIRECGQRSDNAECMQSHLLGVSRHVHSSFLLVFLLEVSSYREQINRRIVSWSGGDIVTIRVVSADRSALSKMWISAIDAPGAIRACGNLTNHAESYLGYGKHPEADCPTIDR